MPSDQASKKIARLEIRPLHLRLGPKLAARFPHLSHSNTYTGPGPGPSSICSSSSSPQPLGPTV
eukprot:89626-Karenia_brevis.AAC.1